MAIHIDNAYGIKSELYFPNDDQVCCHTHFYNDHIWRLLTPAYACLLGLM